MFVLISRVYLVLLTLLLGGCGFVADNYDRQDPFESINRSLFDFNETLDRVVIKPVAQDYEAVVPAPAREMVNNFFSNLDDANVALNDVLQLKFELAMKDLWRTLINTTLGILGVIDTATALGYEKHHEDFGMTMANWGFGSGPYLMLPFFGPSSVRECIGLYNDKVISPVGRYCPVFTRHQTLFIKTVRDRNNLQALENMLDIDAVTDPYSFLRAFYLQRHNGGYPHKKYVDEEDD